MKVKNVAELLPMLEGVARGEQWQVRMYGQPNPWIDLKPEDGIVLTKITDYRIKPEPRRVFYAQDNDGKFVREFKSREIAEQWLDDRRISLMTSDFTIVEFVEVIS